MGKAATNKKLELPPQANSFIFNTEGKLKEITIGYVLDRRIGNTGGLGGNDCAHQSHNYVIITRIIIVRIGMYCNHSYSLYFM